MVEISGHGEYLISDTVRSEEVASTLIYTKTLKVNDKLINFYKASRIDIDLHFQYSKMISVVLLSSLSILILFSISERDDQIRQPRRCLYDLP